MERSGGWRGGIAGSFRLKWLWAVKAITQPQPCEHQDAVPRDLPQAGGESSEAALRPLRSWDVLVQRGLCLPSENSENGLEDQGFL